MKNSEQGFTLPETLAAIGIITLSIIMVLGFFSSSVMASSRSKDSLFFFMDMLKADEEIRNTAAGIVIPYWERRLRVAPLSLEPPFGDTTAIEIPWYGGREDAVLRISVDDHNRLTMETKGAAETEIRGAKKSLTIADVRLLCDGKGIPYGLRVNYDYHGRQGYTIAPFSTFPVGAALEVPVGTLPLVSTTGGKL
ncbi:hypothetical protein FACS1894130_08780 [Spirochaetia bacterium]|nr:hypothetical protein FACS1894130_08780 [Spirochaetia bacterium]